MYASPLNERIRKRKAFADSELNSNAGLIALPPPTLSGIPNSPHFLSHSQSMYAMQMYAQEDRYRFHKVNQPTEELTANRFVPRNEHHLLTRSCTDETTFVESNSTSPSTVANTFCGIKPKLSFSIESIIGIK